MNIQLKTGNTITISTYEWLFVLKEEDIEQFLESCVADDLGTYIENPFSNKASFGKLEVIEDEDIEDLEN